MQTKNIMVRRYIGMLLGVLVISIGIALFKESHLGNDPISALNMRLAEIFGISLGQQNMIANVLFFMVQLAFGRKYIGAGTFANGILVGKLYRDFLLRNIYKALRLCGGARFGGTVDLGKPCGGGDLLRRFSIPDSGSGGCTLRLPFLGLKR